MAVMGHHGPLLPFDFKNILIKSKLINEMTNQLRQQMKNKMQVKAEINLVSDINLKCKF